MKAAPAKKAKTKAWAKKPSRRAARTPPRAAEAAPQLVRLEVEDLPAAAVCVAGCFNEWSETATPMTALEPGRWSVELSLLPGRYEYLLVVDGQWQTDPRCPQHVPNPYGTENCVLEVLGPA